MKNPQTIKFQLFIPALIAVLLIGRAGVYADTLFVSSLAGGSIYTFDTSLGGGARAPSQAGW